MNTDARISVGLPGHPKTKKLIRRGGQAAAWNLVCLFLWVSQNKPSGDLSGMSDEDIEIAADWAGDEGAFVQMLADVRFLDGEPGHRSVHDWEEHNPWASGADRRAEKARTASRTRWGIAKTPAPECSEDAPSMPGACSTDATSMLVACSEHASSNAQFDSSNAQSQTSNAQFETSNAKSETSIATSAIEQCPVSVSVSVSKSKREARFPPPDTPAAMADPPTASPVGSAKRGSRLDPGWVLPDDWLAEAQVILRQSGSTLDLRRESEKFRDFWVAKPGKDGLKLDWPATWRNWIRRASEGSSKFPQRPAMPEAPALTMGEWR